MEKIVIHKSSSNGRPIFLLFDTDEKVIDIPAKYALFLNSNLRFSPNSLFSYVNDVKNFLEFSVGDLDSASKINSLTRVLRSSSVHSFLMSMKNRNLSDNTIRSADRRLKYFFDWLYSFKSGEGLSHEESPYASGRLISPEPYKTQHRFLTYKEVAEYLKTFSSEHDRVLGHFMYDVGLRVSEVERVYVSDLPDPNDYPDYFSYYPITIRSSKGRGGLINEHDSLISKVVLNRIWQYYNNWVKPNLSKADKSKLVFRNTLLRPIKKKTITDTYLRKSKTLVDNGMISKRINPHRLRHGAAFSIINSDFGKDMIDKLVIVKKQLGHSHLKSTEVYANAPISVLIRIRELNNDPLVLTRFQEAEYIYQETFTRPKLNR